MPVNFLIPAPLRSFVGGRSHIVVEQSPTTLADALEALWKRCPGIRDRVVTEQAEIREHINVFVGDQDVRYTGGLQTPILDGAEISIIPVISGGSGTKRQNAIHLGEFTVTWEATVNLENNSGIGSYHFIAANGDSIFAAVVGQAELAERPDVFRVVEIKINTITGGTGRFAGAKGASPWSAW
jgi:sulfur-carrier protein